MGSSHDEFHTTSYVKRTTKYVGLNDNFSKARFDVEFFCKGFQVVYNDR